MVFPSTWLPCLHHNGDLILGAGKASPTIMVSREDKSKSRRPNQASQNIGTPGLYRFPRFIPQALFCG